MFLETCSDTALKLRNRLVGTSTAASYLTNTLWLLRVSYLTSVKGMSADHECALSCSGELLQGQRYRGPGQTIVGSYTFLSEVVLTGWTRIGLIGPEMAQKRSSPFLYRWPSWSAWGELARMAAWDHPADQGARRHSKSMSTPKQGRARE